ENTGWIRYGKCFQFAGLMSFMLVSNDKFKLLNLGFEVARYGIGDLGHYFLVVGRAPKSEFKDVNNWGNDAFVFDVWGANQSVGRAIRTSLTSLTRLKEDECVFEPQDYSFIMYTGVSCVTFKPPFDVESALADKSMSKLIKKGHLPVEWLQGRQG